MAGEVYPDAVLVLHTYEFALLTQNGVYKQFPRSIVVVIPNDATHEQRMEFLKSVAVLKHGWPTGTVQAVLPG